MIFKIIDKSTDTISIKNTEKVIELGILNYLNNTKFPKSLILKNIDLELVNVNRDLNELDNKSKLFTKKIDDMNNQVNKYKNNNRLKIQDYLIELS